MKALIAMALMALPALGDELVLRDGRKIAWESLSDEGDSYSVKTKDGAALKVKKSEIDRVVIAREPAPGPLTGASFTLNRKEQATTDLLPKVKVNGETWKVEGRALVAKAAWPVRAVVSVDVEVPEEYDLSLVVERVGSGTKDFAVGIVSGAYACGYHLDSWDATRSGLALIDGQEGEHIEGQVFRSGKPRAVKIQVRKDAVMVLLDGKEFWKSRIDWRLVKPHQAVTLPEPGRLFLVAAGGSWKVSAFTITSVK